jgi:cytochrome c
MARSSTRPVRIVTRLTRTTSGRVIAAYFGRKAASLPDYDYSDALKSANIVWNEETLDKWLTDPQAVAPGAKMFFHLDNPQDRADVIAYPKDRAK